GGGGDGFRLEGEGPGPRRRARSLYVLDATGRSRWVARRCGSRSVESYDRQIAIVADLRPLSSASLSAALLLEACETGWWYSVPTPGDRAVAAFITDADLLVEAQKPEALWLQALKTSRHTQERLAGSRAESVRVQASGTSRLRDPAGRGWAAIGDAAMVFDPLSSSGIMKALRTGVNVARDLAHAGATSDLVLPGYRERCDEEFAEYYKTLRWFYAKEQRWPRSPFWQRRHEWLIARGP
ncbi:MAG TPA: hypothetical protein VNO21_26900, partial [Polyangiaceae bacterium]|nr:hypothetical protein [Polyangiaceae bacterium]